MERPEVNVSARTVLGKKVKALRRAGLIPAHLYGRGVPSQALQIEAGHLRQVLARAGRNVLLSLCVDGHPPQIALVREVQRDPPTSRLLHVDFYAVKMTEKIRAEVSVVLVGEAPVARAGEGIVVQILNALEVECLPGDLLPRLEVDLNLLAEPGQSIFVRNLTLPPAWTLLTDPDQVVVMTAAPAMAPEAAEAPAPEVAAATEESEAEA